MGESIDRTVKVSSEGRVSMGCEIAPFEVGIKVKNKKKQFRFLVENNGF
jgi:hypothetical protein